MGGVAGFTAVVKAVFVAEIRAEFLRFFCGVTTWAIL